MLYAVFGLGGFIGFVAGAWWARIKFMDAPRDPGPPPEYKG